MYNGQQNSNFTCCTMRSQGMLCECSIRKRTDSMLGGAGLAPLGNSGSEEGPTGTDGGNATLVREVLSAHSLTSVFPDNPIIQISRRLRDKSSASTLNGNRCDTANSSFQRRVSWEEAKQIQIETRRKWERGFGFRPTLSSNRLSQWSLRGGNWAV